MKKNIISGLFFLINIAFVVVSQLFFFEGNIAYNYTILAVLLLLTVGYFSVFGKCYEPIRKFEIVIHFALTTLYAILVSTSVYYISFMKATYTFNTIVGIVLTALFFNSMRLLSARIKDSHSGLSRFIFVFGAFMFFGFLLCGIINIFSPGTITSRL